MERAPALWRFYGSNDGIYWTVMSEASNETALRLESYAPDKFYVIPLSGTFTTSYRYYDNI